MSSYFTLPDEGLDSPQVPCPELAGFSCSASRGFRVMSWTRAGLLHALVGSDEESLLRLARSL